MIQIQSNGGARRATKQSRSLLRLPQRNPSNLNVICNLEMTPLPLCRRGSPTPGSAPKRRTIKTVFSLLGSDDLEGGIFQSNWYIRPNNNR